MKNKGVIGVLLLLLLVFSSIFFLGMTQRGLGVITSSLSKIFPDTVDVGDVHGRLLGRWSVKSFSFRASDFTLDIEEISCDWQPLALLKKNIFVSLLKAKKFQLHLKKEDGQIEKKDTTFQNLKLPFSIDIKSLGIEDMWLVTESGVKRWDKLLLSLQVDKNEVLLPSLQIEAKNKKVNLEGKATLSDNDWQAFLHLSKSDLAVVSPQLDGLLDGKIHIQAYKHDSYDRFTFKIEEMSGTLSGYPLQAHGSVECRNSSCEVSGFTVQSGKAQLQIHGSLAADLDIQTELSVPVFNEIVSDFHGSLVSSGRLTGSKTAPIFHSDILVKGLGHKTELFEKIEGSISLKIAANGETEGRLLLDEVSTGDTTYSNSRVIFTGTPKQHFIELSLSEKLGWLNVSLKGEMKEERWKGSIDKFDFSYPASKKWSLGDNAHLEIVKDRGSLSGFCLSAENERGCMEGKWQPQRWDAKLDFQNIQPFALWDSWQAELSGALQGSGNVTDSKSSHLVELLFLDGHIQGEPVKGKGKVLLNDGRIVFDKVSLQSGASSVFIAGEVGDEIDIMAQLRLPDMAKIHPEAKGKLTADVAVNGKHSKPSLVLDFKMEEGVFAPYSAQSIMGSVTLDMTEPGKVTAEIVGEDLKTDFLEGISTKLIIEGNRIAHTLFWNVDSPQGSLSAKGTGSYDKEQWNCLLSLFQIKTSSHGRWESHDKTEILIGKEEAKTDDFCLTSSHGEICLKGNWQKGKHWNISAQVPSLSFAWLDVFFDDLAFKEGEVKVDLLVEGFGKTTQKLDGKIEISQAIVAIEDNENFKDLELESAACNVNYFENILESTFDLSLGKLGSINGSLQMSEVEPSLKELLHLPLKGRVAIDVRDLSLLSSLSNNGINATGALNGALDLSGSFTAPHMVGELKLVGGSLIVPALGMKFGDLAASIDAEGEKVKLSYGSVTGDGKVSGQGIFSVNQEKGWLFEGKIKSSNFTLIDMPEYTIDADIDADYRLDREGGVIHGELLVPKARIAPEEKSNFIRPSSDVIFVDNLPQEEKKPWQVISDVLISLGKEVQLDTQGLRSRLEGQLRIHNKPGRPTSGVGEIDIKDGTYTVLGKSFTIERGRILFNQGPLNNPSIDVQAKRTIDKTMVGVNINGTVNEYKVTLFSDPFMEESEILAFLLVGRSLSDNNSTEGNIVKSTVTSLGWMGADKFAGKIGNLISLDEITLGGSKEDGDVSLGIGKKLTDDLFVGYDYNFLDSTGDIKIRYTLGRGFYVETRSSAKSTSGDLFYSIKK